MSLLAPSVRTRLTLWHAGVLALVVCIFGSILRNGTWAHAFLCHRCLVTLEQLGRGYNDYEARPGGPATK